MKIIIIDKTESGSYQAHIFPNKTQVFAKTELETLKMLYEKILKQNTKVGKKGKGLYRIYTQNNDTGKLD